MAGTAAMRSVGVSVLGDHPVFDFHVRLGQETSSADGLSAVMDEYGVDRAAACAGSIVDPYVLSRQIVEGGHVDVDADNGRVLEDCRHSEGRLVPFYFANPHAEPTHYAHIGGRYRGLELSPAVHGVTLTDARNVRLVAIAAEFGHPVYVVCLGRAGCGVPDLVQLAERFPAVSFVLGHCGFIGIDFFAIEVVARTPNILAETSGCYTAVVRAALDRLGVDRLLFGSEHPVQHLSVELAKLRALGLSPQSTRKIVWDNASRLIGSDS